MPDSSLTLQEYTEKFLNFEKRHDLFSQKILGRFFWDHIRHLVYDRGVMSINQFSLAKTKKPFFNYFFQLLCYVPRRLNLLVKNKRTCDILLLNTTRTSYYRENGQGFFADIYLYPLCRALQGKYSMLLVNIDGEIGNAKYPCSVWQAHPLTLMSRLKTRFLRFSRSDIEIICSLEKMIETELGAKVDLIGMTKKVFGFQTVFDTEFKQILRKYRPKVLLYVDNGSRKGIIKAAHEMGIIAIECQHAAISPFNILYRYPTGVPAEKIQPTVADYIFSFGSFWRNGLNLPSKIIPVGFPYLELMAQDAQKINPGKKRNGVIVLSVLMSRQHLALITVQLAELLPDFTFYYKLRHDEYNDWQLHYPPEFSSMQNIVVVADEEKTIYDYFALCDYQIGTNSTAIYEGLYFNLKTFILKVGRYEEMQLLIDRGFVFVSSSAEEIAEKIKSCAMPALQINQNALFKHDSLQNIENILSEITRHYDTREHLSH